MTPLLKNDPAPPSHIFSSTFTSNAYSEEDRVFGRHHRKKASHSSIDWSIPNDDLSSLLAESASLTPASNQGEPIEKFDESMGTLKAETKLSIKLPSFVDRLAALGDTEVEEGRWFPFTYEVIILQWAAILVEQQNIMSGPNLEGSFQNQLTDGGEALADAASRTFGAIIACAPILFEIIKQSIGSRVMSLVQRIPGRKDELPPLVTLDDTILANLEQLIAIITDACLDSRNFDSWETRQNCVDVHDSVVCFLRDMFAFLDPSCVYRLTMVYWSRLVSSDGRQWHDRESKINLDISWEITKLQMNAISAFVRFPDLIRVNSPQMNNWGDWWTTAPALSTISFFDDILDRYEKLGQPSILNDDTSQDRMDLPRMKPHWLSEILVDICLAGIEHVEPEFQIRSASLLLEMFWSQGQQSLREGYSSVVASMYISFIEKVLTRTSYLATCFAPKSQVRQNIILCVVFVLQSAPSGLLRALWRKLFLWSTSKGSLERYGGIEVSSAAEPRNRSQEIGSQRPIASKVQKQSSDGPTIYDMFGLLNMCLATVEYEGSDEHAEGSGINDGPLGYWRREFLMAKEKDTSDVARRRRLLRAFGRSSFSSDTEYEEDQEDEYATTSSRKWLSHDSSIVLIRAAQQIVRELRYVLEPNEGAQCLFNPARRKVVDKTHRYRSSFNAFEGHDESTEAAQNVFNFSYEDTIIFVRGATSVYLHSLALKESDIALVKTLNASVEIIKIFGIKIFNEAVGETLQHWMRMITFHCGSRRAEVRVPASDFVELLLRSTWDCFGSFFRIRVPLLAVQIEVMERIVATATARHYRDQRKIGGGIDLFSNASAEASLAPLWRTTDRLHHQSASQNHAFRSSLVRMAEKLKKLHRAYIAAHALSFQNRSKSPDFIKDDRATPRSTPEAETLIRANRISVIRVINASAGYSKQFLGLHGASRELKTLAHNEAVEDAFLEAADVFSPTELPDHRVAWLRRLATFHASRYRYAEEATCHYMVYETFNRSSKLSDSLWSSTPFLPWIDSKTDGIHNEGPVGDPDDASVFGSPEFDYGRQIEKTNSFRRIFYRNENSIRLNGGDLEAGVGKTAFFGVALKSEYASSTEWITHREMEVSMVEEAEAAGDLFKRSGIVASSRFMWSLVTKYYAEKFMYGKLAIVYEELVRTVVSQVPVIDNTLQQEVNVGIPLGNFYRVWFHGGAPDELIGAEYVYRSSTNIRLEKFGNELKKVLWGIIPEKTPIYLELDGRPEENVQQNSSGFTRMGGVPLEPVKVKVTPLRPVVRNASKIRGLPEWFKLYIDNAFGNQPNFRRAWNVYDSRLTAEDASHGNRSHHHARSMSASVYSSSGNVGNLANRNSDTGRHFQAVSALEGELVGADKFWFMQPINKDRRGSKDWLKGASGDFAEKQLRVTQLQVRDTFPACVSRQTVVHRVVFTMSPLEAAFDVICQWCAVLFRTTIASNGSTVLGMSSDPGIGIDAAKVVSECIHSSRVKEMGLMLLKKTTNIEEEDDDVLQSYDRLSDDEVKKFQLKLARSLVVFMELLHLLIARNRDQLLDVIAARKKKESSGGPPPGKSFSRDDSKGSFVTLNRPAHRDYSIGTLGTLGTLATSEANRSKHGPGHAPERRDSEKSTTSSHDGRSREEVQSLASHHGSRNRGSEEDNSPATLSVKDPGVDRARTDSAIGIQRELQLAFINLAKDLYPMILGIMESDTPHWLKLCRQENYFSAYTYRHQKIPIGEELTFEDINVSGLWQDEIFGDGRSSHRGGGTRYSGSTHGGVPRSSSHSDRSQEAPGSPGGSVGSSSVVSKGSDTGRSVRSVKDLKDLKQPVERLASC